MLGLVGYVGPFGGYVGPLLSHFRAMLGLCWVIWGSAGGFRAEKKNPTENVFRRGFFLGRFWAYVGPFGSYVGPLLSHFRAMLGSVRAFRT